MLPPPTPALGNLCDLLDRLGKPSMLRGRQSITSEEERDMTEAEKRYRLVEAVRTALFGVTADADNNNGRVDRVAIAETLRSVLREVGEEVR